MLFTLVVTEASAMVMSSEEFAKKTIKKSEEEKMKTETHKIKIPYLV